MTDIVGLEQVGLQDIATVGGKNASLGEMIQHLTRLHIRVPPGFATTAEAYHRFLNQNNLNKKINHRLEKLKVDNISELQMAGEDIRRWILETPFPDTFTQAIQTAYQRLSDTLEHPFSVAVRSSATAEDLPNASFAGQQETYLNVVGVEHVLLTIRKVYASLFTDRAIAYRTHQGFLHDQVALSAGIQLMVRSDLACSGVLFSLDTESGFSDVVFITGAYGLGETVVQGAVNPDEFYVHKPLLAIGKPAIIRRKLGTKTIKMTYGEKAGVLQLAVPEADRQRYCLSNEEILSLATMAVTIEKHYQRPMDIEWAKDGIDGQLYIVQARPETVQSQRAYSPVIERYQLQSRSTILISGRSVGQKIAQGPAKWIKHPEDMINFPEGSVLVADMTDPDWEPIMKKAAAIVTNRGGRTCHAAIIAREMGIPAIVGCGNATTILKERQPITLSCAEGDTGYVYEGLLNFSVQKTSIDAMPDLPIKIMLNVANPDQAFELARLPNAGIGLARLEFIISRMIGFHPKALLHPELVSVDIQQKIAAVSLAYGTPENFYIEKLTEGVATLAAAFYPKPVIVRLSDFKSNEYAHLIGGSSFEPQEENPMLGFRGASRYISQDFEACFALECAAIKRAREVLGLKNIQVMIPFVRTLEEAAAVINVLAAHGLRRKEEDLKLIMMCEIPSNALLADQFLEFFDGFSIGSNDLTQLTLGLDRDSGLVANRFDERNPAVYALLELAIRACQKANKYIGICGQGPSDHSDFAEWLLKQGIQSISLNPDSVVDTWLKLSALSTLNNSND